MRLFQIVALAAFSLLLMKLSLWVSSGFFEEITVSPANAQEQTETAPQQNAEDQNTKPAEEKTQTDNNPVSQEDRNADLANVEGLEDVRTRSSRSSIADRLGERREALAKRERDIELREQLLKAAEARLKSRIAKLKQFEEKAAEEEKGASDKASKDLVTIYENMKPKDAAKIFDALSLDILHMLATSMNPRKMSAILAEMDVKQAERLTVEIAVRAAHGKRSKSKKRRLEKIKG